MKRCFLNRISNSTFLKMFGFKKWLSYFLKQSYCLILFNLGLYKQTYKQLKKYFKEYENNYTRKIYAYKAQETDLEDFAQIDEIINSNNIKTAFILGEKSAQWSINSISDTKKFVYLDDYDLCDEFYNYIYQNKFDKITTAVIYPFMQDKEINQNYSYRGIYDYFAKERFNSEAVVILNSDELYKNKEFDIKEFCENIVEFSSKLYIHKFDKSNENDLMAQFKAEIEKYYYDVKLIETSKSLVLFAKDKQLPLKDYSHLPKYLNGNRGAEAKQQSIELFEMLKNNKNS